LTAKNSFKVLITSLSNKVPLVREVRKALKKIAVDSCIFGADCNPSCIGRYFVNVFWEMPPTDKLDPDAIVGYCLSNGIRSIIPTRDGELPFFAENIDRFNNDGIAVMISSKESVRICLDKQLFFNTLNSQTNLNPILTLDHPDPNHGDHWVVKERYGAGSKNILLDATVETARSSLDRFSNPICQPYIHGREYSVDLYLSQKAIPKGCIVRTRDVVIHGESQVTTTIPPRY
jgi:carbamoyl-phosphate synthase large subunit